MQTVEQALDKLSRSKFRGSFKLTKKEREYINEKGMDVIQSHTRDFVRQKIASANPLNDGRQTPMHGHPSFKAMHATACCCRGCLEKWYKIKPDRDLTEDEQNRIVKLIIAWINRQLNN